MADDVGEGISVEQLSLSDGGTGDEASLNAFQAAEHAHRHDVHSFFLLEHGTISIDIDFQTYTITPPSLIYVHPNQVHRVTASGTVVVSSWLITREHLHPEYLQFLEDITPARPIVVDQETLSIITTAVSLCIRLAEHKDDKLYYATLRDSCNALVAFVISQYLQRSTATQRLSRFETIARSFDKLLELDYVTTKRPAAYAHMLNISTPYLNECVKHATGHPVSYHIQQRVILEAKRLLYHSNQSVKEIAAALGYADHAYFSRLFTRVVGMTPLTFRRKNRD